MADRTLKVRVVSPAETVFEGEASSLVVPAWDGLLGVLPGHAPLLALLGGGELSIDRPGGGSREFHVAGGVLKVGDDEVTILTEYAGSEPPVSAEEHVWIEPDDYAFGVAGNPLT